MKKYLIAGIVAFTVALAGAASANAAFNANLSVGSTGADVSALQAWLISKGFAIPSISSGAAQPGYFGQQTKTAVIAYQASVGLPNTGFVGPLTRGILNGSSVPSTPSVVVCPVGYTCQANPGTNPSTPSTGSLAGTDGSIETVDLLSQYSNEEVGDGETDVKVAGFEVEASNDGDVALRSIKVVFDPSGNSSGDSDRLKDYIEAVTVWQGSTEVGSADVSDFTETSDDTWTKTITLKNSVVRADSTEKFYISVDAISNFDSGDIDSDSWTVAVENIRFEDGSGVVTTETSAIDTSLDWDAAGDGVAIAFVDFSTAADTELKISKDSSSPQAMIVVVDDSDDTDDVTLLVGKIKIEGTSDVLVDEFPVTLSTAGDSVGALTGTLILKIDGEEFTETVGLTAAQTGTVTFDNLDLNLEAGKTYTFTVAADINDTNNSGVTATDFDEGDALVASVTATNRQYIDAENEEGDALSESEKTGTAIGEGQEFRTNGIGLTLVSTDTSVATGQSSNDDLGTFKIKFKVTAIGDTVYVSTLANAALSGNTTGTTVLVDRAGTATVGGVSVTLTNTTDSTLTSVGNYMIEEGESETFELTATVQLPTAGAAGQFRAALGGVRWATTDDASPLTNSYTSELDTFKTSYVGLN